MTRWQKTMQNGGIWEKGLQNATSNSNVLNKGVQEAFNQSNEYQLSDCASYFLSNARRLSNSGYVPTTQDILHTRVRTCGVVEVQVIFFQNQSFYLVDSYLFLTLDAFVVHLLIYFSSHLQRGLLLHGLLQHEFLTARFFNWVWKYFYYTFLII